MSAVAKPPRLSGLQRQVRALYRRCVRAALEKSPSSGMLEHVRHQFKRYEHVDKQDFRFIEWLLRRGERQLQLLRMPQVASVSTQKGRSQT
mmetsp:Transcript_9478/g.34767  ORF Transcript_9478/g.34767 Transcript_9478/m.34767 type:complete len:91 (+) Transcript_9478:114-386(+)